MNHVTVTWIKQFGPVLILIVVALGGFIFLRDVITFDTLKENRDILVEIRNDHFLWIVAGFLCFYIFIVAFSLPGASVASVTGGFLFGLTLGTVLNVLAASTGAIVIFAVIKAGFGKMVVSKIDKLGGRPAFLKAKLQENEVSILLMLRLIPVVPFFAVNVISALVDVKLKNFAFSTFFGIIPGALVFTWIGVGIGELFNQSATPDLSIIWSPNIIGPLIGLSLLAGAPLIFRKFRPEEL